jgi:hypothetical protein
MISHVDRFLHRFTRYEIEQIHFERREDEIKG